MITNLYVIYISSQKEREEIKKQLGNSDIIREIKKQLPYDCCGRASYSVRLPENLYYNDRGIRKDLFQEKPWVFAGNTKCFIPICIWHYCGGWVISTDGLWFELGGDVEKYGADYFLSWESAEEIIREKDEHITFLEINEKLESKMWNKFIEESK